MTRAPVRIVHVIPHDGLGGVETAARSMAGAKVDSRCAFSLVLIAGSSVDRRNPAILGSPYRSTLNPLALLRAVRQVLDARPDVVLFSLWRSVAVMLGVKLLRPSAKMVYFLNAERSIHLVDRLLSGLAVRVADEVWTDSRATLRARCPGNSKGRVISFVTDRLAPAHPPPAPRASFVSWSRLIHQKGYDRSIRLIALLVGRKIDAQLDLWGPDAGALDRLRQLAKECGVLDRVHFRGPLARNQLAASVGDSSFFLQPSRFEGLSMACVEAMQLGLVPVVTPAGEIANYVRHGDNGILIDPDRLEAAAADIARLIGDPDSYRAMRDKAIAEWSAARLYSDDICAGALALADRQR